MPEPSEAKAPQETPDCPKCHQPVSGPHECYESVLNQAQEVGTSDQPPMIMKTVTDHKYISEVCHEHGCQYLVLTDTKSAYDAGYRAGRESAIREAAKVADSYHIEKAPDGCKSCEVRGRLHRCSYHEGCDDTADLVMGAIAAMPLSGKEDKKAHGI